LTWIRSRRCESNACVEVARTEHGMAMRSSLRPDVVLEFGAEQWRAFLDLVKETQWATDGKETMMGGY